MAEERVEAMLRDADGVPETVYVSRSQVIDGGWTATSLDVGSWRPLSRGDVVVALATDSRDEFVVEVAAVEVKDHEVYYRLRHLADLDSEVEPTPDSTRPWRPRSS